MKEIRMPYRQYRAEYSRFTSVHGSYDEDDKTVLVRLPDKIEYTPPDPEPEEVTTPIRMPYSWYKKKYTNCKKSDYNPEDKTVIVYLPESITYEEPPEPPEWKYVDMPFPEWQRDYHKFKKIEYNQRTGMVTVRFPAEFHYSASDNFKNYEMIHRFNTGALERIDIEPEEMTDFKEEFGFEPGYIPAEFFND